MQVVGHPPRKIKGHDGKIHIIDEWGDVRGSPGIVFPTESYDDAGGKPEPSATVDSSGSVKLTVSVREDYSCDLIEHLIQAELQSKKWALNKENDAMCLVPDGGEGATVKVDSFKGMAYDASGNNRKMRPDLCKHQPKFHIKDFGVGPGDGFIAMCKLTKA